MPPTPVVRASGAEIPVIGLGTWPLKGEDCARAVAHSIDVGYRHIDTAAMYANEEALGEGLRHSKIGREAVFLTTKVWHEDIAPGDLQRSAEASLRWLGVNDVDLLLIHWPNPKVPMADSIGALCDAQRRGLTRHIGVSNFTTRQIAEALRTTSEPLVCNQIEYHPNLDQRKVISATRAAGMAVVGYCPLGRGDVGGVLNNPASDRLQRVTASLLPRSYFAGM